MKFKTTLLLIVLNIVVFFFLLRQESPFDLKEKITNEDLSFLPFPMAEATGIEVLGEGVEQSYRLKRVENNWILETPIEWAANPFAVRRMISRLESTDATIHFPVSDIQSRNQTLADFGLENPEFLVRVWFESEVFEFAFGAPVEIGDRLYLLSPDKDEILVVKANILLPFLMGLDDLRLKQLFSIPEFEIQSLLVEFNDEGTRRRFTRSESKWMIDTPFLAKANGERVQSAIDRLVNYDVQIVGSSVGDQLKVNHFNSFARFEVIGNRRNSTLLVSQYMINGEVNPDFYRGRLEGTETIFLIPQEEIDWWRTSQSRLRERQILAFKLEDISKLELLEHTESPSNLRILKLENENWKMYTGLQVGSAVDYAVDPALVVDTLARLSNLVALEFVIDNPSSVDLEEFGLLEPSREIVIEGAITLRLQAGMITEDGQGIYVKLEDSSSVYLAANEVFEEISSDPLDYRERSIRLMDPDTEVSYFTIEDMEQGGVIHNQTLEDLVDSSVQSIEIEDAKAIDASMRVILREFAVAGFVDQTFDPEGIDWDAENLTWRYRLSYFTNYTEMQKIGEMYLTKRLSGTGQLAYIPSRDLIVKLNQNMIDVLHPLLFDPRIPEEYLPPVPIEKMEPNQEVEESEVIIPDAENGIE